MNPEPPAGGSAGPLKGRRVIVCRVMSDFSCAACGSTIEPCLLPR